MDFARIIRAKYKGIQGQVLLTVERPTERTPNWGVLIRVEFTKSSAYSFRKFRTLPIALDYLKAYTGRDANLDFKDAVLYVEKKFSEQAEAEAEQPGQNEAE